MIDFRSFIIGISLKVSPSIHNKMNQQYSVGMMHLKLQNTFRKFITFLYKTGPTLEKEYSEQIGL